MTNARRDIHRPSEIVPSEYSVLFAYSDRLPVYERNPHTGEATLIESFNMERREAAERDAREHGNWFAGNGGCSHCGSNFLDGVVVRHNPSQQVMVWGWICANKLSLLAGFDAVDFEAYRKKVKKARAAAAKEKRHAKAFAKDVDERGIEAELLDSDDPEIKAAIAKAKRYGGFKSDAQVDFLRKRSKAASEWLIYLHNNPDVETASEIIDKLVDQANECDTWDQVHESTRIASDIIHKGRRWGSISDGQRDLLLKIAGVNQPEDTRKPAPEGRHMVDVIVRSFKLVDDHYSYCGGQIKKMVGEHADGWKVWCTVTDPMSAAEVGDSISMNVTLQPSDDDKHFAFGKRPAKVTVIPAVEDK